MRGPHPQSHVTLRYHGHVINKKRYISTFTRPMDLKISRVVLQDEGTSSTKSRDTQNTCSRGKSKCYISTFTGPMDPKLSRMVTQDEENPPIKSHGNSIVGSRDKSKIFCLPFHKAQGPQTQQDGDQNEKTPLNTSCATSITPSRDNYLVGSVHLLHFQFKPSPKSRQISNDYDNSGKMQLV